VELSYILAVNGLEFSLNGVSPGDYQKAFQKVKEILGFSCSKQGRHGIANQATAGAAR
jgi:hypothetical protein